MRLDDRARRAAEELTEAIRAARFTVRSPAIDSRVSWPTVAVTTLLVAVAVGAPLLWTATRSHPVGGVPANTTAAPTAATTTTTFAIPSFPAATVEELITGFYAALNDRDDEAVRSLSRVGARHTVYVAEADAAGITATFAYKSHRISDDGIEQIEIIGEPIESGATVTVPVRYRYSGATEVYEGFDVMVVTRVPDGLLIAGGASFLGASGLTIDPTTSATSETERAAWNADDRDGVLAVFADDGFLWDDLTDPDAIYAGDDLWAFVSGSLWFEVDFTAEPILSGPFAAIPTRLVATGSRSDGITLYLVRDGRIVVQAFAQ
ncbi:MAG: nuclear transport factor 2 family protein [Acidimicrobiia bacterium]|nr:nuclear transport factor 2 family protein [Acidimicrobiia bacterium]